MKTPTTLPKATQNNFDKGLRLANEFIQKNYGINPMEYDFQIKYSRTARFAKFDPYQKTIRVIGRKSWILYRKKTIGLTTANAGEYYPKLSEYLAFMTELVHEFTHLVQYLEARNYSEVETTRNEIELMRQVEPYYYNKLKPIA